MTAFIQSLVDGGESHAGFVIRHSPCRMMSCIAQYLSAAAVSTSNASDLDTHPELSVTFRTVAVQTSPPPAGRLRLHAAPNPCNLTTTLRFDGTDATGAPLATGLYVVRLRSGGVRVATKMVLLN